MEKNQKAKFGLLPQLAVIFLIGSFLIGSLTYITQFLSSRSSVKEQTERIASGIAEEVKNAIYEYPAYPWLLEYWQTHKDTLDLNYDEKFWAETQTEIKSREFSKRHPEIDIRYIDTMDIISLSEEDKKLYAEIAYSWIITRANQIKKSFGVDYLFCVMSEEPYSNQFFIFSASDDEKERGTDYESIYTLGVEVEVGESQQKAMQDARYGTEYLAEAGEYVDYYSKVYNEGKKAVFIGLTYNTAALESLARTQANRQSLRALLYQAILALVFLLSMFFFVIRPLKSIQKNIHYYGETKDSNVVRGNLEKIKPKNEIGTLSKDVQTLTSEMDDYVKEIETITAKTQRINAELELASRIQSNSLPNTFPPFPERKEFDLYANMDPAKEVGGDFYDYFLIDDDHLAITIADVSGKGVPASLFMMISMVLIHITATNGLDKPSKVLERINEQICANNPEEMFVSVWMGILEISTGKLVASNAGHEYPIIKNGEEDYEVLKDSHGLVIGAMNNAKYKDYEVQLKPNSKVFVYTDGLPEATDKDDNMFGMERIVEALNKDNSLDVKDTVFNMRSEVSSFVKDAEQFDDLTMVCLSYFGNNN